MGPTTLDQIEKLTRQYAEAAGALREEQTALEAELEAIKRKRLRKLRALVADTADAKAALQSAIEQGRELFDQPKTQTFAGVKVGYRKAKGGLDWEDDETLVERIERTYKDHAEDYLIIKKKPSADALEDLDAAELKKLGVEVVNTGDVPTIKHVDGEVEKLVKALLKEKLEEAMNEER